jgi:hypothetical protein
VKPNINKKGGMNMTRKGLRLCFPVVISAMLVTGCETGSNGFSGLGINGMNWFSSSETGEGEAVILAQDPAMLSRGSQIEKALHNSVELARQKRFLEARHILSEVRETQQPSGEGYRAITCAMALLALKEGDLETFKRVARQLDMSLGQPVDVEEPYVEVVTLYRTFANESLPVNAPEKMRIFKDRYFGVPKTEKRLGT